MSNQNQNFKVALLQISEGLALLANAIGEIGMPEVPQEEALLVAKDIVIAPIVLTPPVEAVESEATLDSAELNGMKYNDLKKLAKEMGLDAKGTKQELVDRLSSTPVEYEEEEEQVEDFEEEETEEEIEEKIEEEEEAEEEEDTLEDKIAREMKDTSNEELIEILTDIGVSPKGKRQALLAKVVKAIRDGLLEFDSEDEEEEEEEIEEPVVEAPKSSKGKSSKKAPEPVEEEEEEEEIVITKARKKAMLEVAKEVKRMIKEGEISIKEINEQLEEYFTPEEGYSAKLPKNEKIEMFIEMQQSLVDDEGEQREPSDPYELNGELACCGKHLSELDNGNVYCAICGEEYSLED